MSMRGWIVKQILKISMSRSMEYADMRKSIEKLGRARNVSRDIIIEKTEIAGVQAEWAYPTGTGKKKIIIFLHGGSYCVGSVSSYRAFTTGLAKESKLPVLSVDYRLAPEYPFPAALNDVKAVYNKLLATGTLANDIIFLGDSAGGGLSMAVAMSLRDLHLPLPKAIALLSPWMDLSMSSESCLVNASKDFVNYIDFDRKCAIAYANGEDITNHLVSPVFGHFKNIPPLFIHGAAIDIYLDDSIKTINKARADGVDVTYKIWKGMFHIFTVFYKYTPEGKKSFQDLVVFIKHHLSQRSCNCPEQIM